jgi:hypothetical protein
MSMVLIAVSLVALITLVALVVDFSRLHVRRQALVNGCDAAAMSGALELPSQDAARNKAATVAAANGLGGLVTVTFPNAYEIQVSSEESVTLGLARVVGIATGRVAATARAARGTANSIRGNSPTGVRPWGLSSTYAIQYTGQSVPLKLGEHSDSGETASNGNFYSLRLGELSGASDYATAIQYGGTAEYRSGDFVASEPGNKVGPTKQGVDALVSRASAAPWSTQSPPNVSADNPRVILMPIVDWATVTSNHSVRIVGFAAVYLVGMDGQSVQGIFLQHLSPANANIDPALPPGVEGGVLVTRMVE